MTYPNPNNGYRLITTQYSKYGANLILPAMIGKIRALLDGGISGVMGIVASRTSIADVRIANTSTLMQRLSLVSGQSPITQLKAVFNNWIGDEQDPSGSTMTVKCSVEYPAGVFTQVKFSNSPTGIAPPLTNLFSDWAVVKIPANTVFWLRFTQTGSASYLGSSVRAPNTVMGDAQTFPGTDQTMGGTVVSNINGVASPLAVIGLTQSRNVIHLGDSRGMGNGGSWTRSDGLFGEMPIALSQNCGANFGVPGRTAVSYLAANTLRSQVINMLNDSLTTVVNELGVNDIFVNTRTSAQLIADQTAIRALYSKKKFCVTTLDPETTSTDSWVTLANQTVRTNEAARITYNTAVRANALGFNAGYDCAAISESSLNSGKWKVDGTPNKYTGDGTHQTAFCYNLYQTAGMVLP